MLSRISRFLPSLRQFRNDLHPAGARPDHRHLFAGQPDRMIPSRGMHDRAAEVGAYVAGGAYLVTVIPAHDLWVDAAQSRGPR